MLMELIVYANGVRAIDERTMKENDSISEEKYEDLEYIEIKKKEEIILKKEELLLNSIAVCTNITFYTCMVRNMSIFMYV
jgi:hypothetical protein